MPEVTPHCIFLKRTTLKPSIYTQNPRRDGLQIQLEAARLQLRKRMVAIWIESRRIMMRGTTEVCPDSRHKAQIQSPN